MTELNCTQANWAFGLRGAARALQHGRVSPSRHRTSVTLATGPACLMVSRRPTERAGSSKMGNDSAECAGTGTVSVDIRVDQVVDVVVEPSPGQRGMARAGARHVAPDP